MEISVFASSLSDKTGRIVNNFVPTEDRGFNIVLAIYAYKHTPYEHFVQPLFIKFGDYVKKNL
jgi:hypothetical protein